MSVGIHQGDVPGPGTALLLTLGISVSCVLGVAGMAQDRGMGEQ